MVSNNVERGLDMKLGVDLSIQDELDQLKPHYTHHGQEIEPFHFFAEHGGMSLVRIRLWNDPHDGDGNPYGGGTNDLDCFLRLAKRAKKEGMDVMLDFHYSDFWADPSHQECPKMWRGLTRFDDVKKALYEFTKKTLITIRDNGIDLAAIQVGNEITHGMVFPFGEINREYNPETGGGFKGHCLLLKEGVKACREIFPNAKIILHIEHSGSYDMQEGYWDYVLEQGVDFDVMGESYYPYWHGNFGRFKDCVSRLIRKYGKEVWLVEFGYQYQEDKNPNFAEVTDAEEGDFIVGNVNGRIPYVQTKEGQAEYVALLLKVCKEIGVGAVCCWEPTWIYIPGNGWAKDAGQIYLGFEPVPAGNSWAYYAFFDESGDANPVIDVFTQKYVDSL